MGEQREADRAMNAHAKLKRVFEKLQQPRVAGTVCALMTAGAVACVVQGKRWQEEGLRMEAQSTRLEAEARTAKRSAEPVRDVENGNGSVSQDLMAMAEAARHQKVRWVRTSTESEAGGYVVSVEIAGEYRELREAIREMETSAKSMRLVDLKMGRQSADEAVVQAQLVWKPVKGAAQR